MKAIFVLVVLTLLNFAPGAKGQNTPQLTPAEQTVTVEGTADDTIAAHADKVAAARLSACKTALMEVAPVLVDSRSLASAHVLVAKYDYVEVQGFVQSAIPLNDGHSVGGVFKQRYQVKVNTGDFNLELIKRKVDVRFLYDLVNRPKICLALDSESNGIVQRYFHKKHPGFKFIDLTLLRSSGKEDADYVREAQKQSFDVLVLGHTEGRQRTSAPKPHKDGTVIIESGASSLVKVNWRALNVHDQSTICSVADSGEDGPSVYPPDENETVTGRSAAKLFRELLSAWNTAARERSIRISFVHFGRADPAVLATQLGAVSGLNRTTIRQESFTGTKLNFIAAPSLSLPEIQSGLQRAFSNEFEIASVNEDQIVLVEAKARAKNIALTVREVAIGELRAVEAKLKLIEGVSSVQRVSLAEGVAKLIIQSHQTAEDIGVALEEEFDSRLKTRGLTDTALEMHFSDSGRAAPR